MKKIILLTAFIIFVSCKKTQEKEPLYPETTKTPEQLQIELGKELFDGVGNCFSCHRPEQKIIGPSIKEIAQIYKDQNADMVEFLKGKGKPIVDPSQYEVMRSNFVVTKNMTDTQLQALEQYMLSFVN